MIVVSWVNDQKKVDPLPTLAPARKVESAP